MKSKTLHPGIWWTWAGAISIALAREDNLWTTGVVVTFVSLVVFSKSEDPAHAPWARSYRWALQLGLWIVSIRTVVGVLIGVPTVGTELFTLPTISLPSWLAGIRIGGGVYEERLISTLKEGLALAAIIAVLAAATALTNPHRLLRALPIVVYEFGVAVVISTTLVPQLVMSIKRIRQAQLLRGQSLKGVKSWLRVATPLLEESLSRSLELAAAMDSRGYGISRRRSRYRNSPLLWNEYVILALSALTLFSPASAVLLAVIPLLLVPNQRSLSTMQGER